MAAQYRYQHDGQELGPVSGRELKRLAVARGLLPTDLVWEEGTTKRVAAAKIKRLFDPLPTTPQGVSVEAEPAAEPAAIDTTSTAAKSKVAASAKALLSRGWREALGTASATAAQSRRLMSAGLHKRQEHHLRRTSRQAQCDLGERLFKESLGDAEMLAALTTVNERILSLAAAKTSTRAAANERSSLQARLAEPFLDLDPPVGLQSEHHRAVESRRALNEHMARGADVRQGLWPAERGDRLRVAAGAAATVLILFSLGYRMMGTAGETAASPTPEEAFAQTSEGEGIAPADQTSEDAVATETWEEPVAAAEEEYVNETGIGTFQNALSQFQGLGGGGGGFGGGGGLPAASSQTAYQVSCRSCGFTQTVGSYEQAESIRNMHQQNAGRMSAMQRGAAAQQHITVVMPVR